MQITSNACHASETVPCVLLNRGADKSDEILREYEGDLLAGLGGVHLFIYYLFIILLKHIYTG